MLLINALIASLDNAGSKIAMDHFMDGFSVFGLISILDSLTPEQKERLFDNNTSQFGDTDAEKFAERKILVVVE